MIKKVLDSVNVVVNGSGNTVTVSDDSESITVTGNNNQVSQESVSENFNY